MMSNSGDALFIGLTGCIGTGKSTVSRYLKEKGYPVIDADALARKCVMPGEPAYYKLRAHFGDLFFFENGELDRKRLGAYVFGKPEALAFLNETIHPEVRREMLEQYECLSKTHAVVIADIPLLIESNLVTLFDSIWLVYAPFELSLQRIVARDDCDEDLARKKLQSQMSIEDKVPFADVVFKNIGTLESLYDAIEDALKTL